MVRQNRFRLKMWWEKKIGEWREFYAKLLTIPSIRTDGRTDGWNGGRTMKIEMKEDEEDETVALSK